MGDGPPTLWEWFARNWQTGRVGSISDLLGDHLLMSLVPIVAGLVLALPLGLASVRWRWLYQPTSGVFNVIYALPSLPVFMLLISVTGLSPVTVIIPLTFYAMAVLIPAVVDGLGSVPDHVRQSAVAMGFTPLRRLVQVELPIAAPVVLGRAARGRRLQHQPGERGRADRPGRPRHALHQGLPEPVPAAGHRRDRADRPAGAGRRRAAGPVPAAAHPVGTGEGDVVTWLTDFFGDPARWSGPDGIPVRLLEHLEFSVLALVLAMLIAIPLGLLIGHTGRGGVVVVVSANLARALPTLGILVLFVLLLGTASIWPVIIPLVLLAVPPILVNTFEGIRGVDPELRDAAYGMGLRGGQVLGRVLVPVALPLILLGLRLSAIQVVATTTVAAYTGLGGLGRFIIDGFATQDYSSVVGGSVLIVLFALVVQLAFMLTQRVTVSPGVSQRLKIR